MADIKIINPEALGKPLGQYSHMTRVKASEYLFIAGQVSVDKKGNVVGPDDFDAQCVHRDYALRQFDRRTWRT